MEPREFTPHKYQIPLIETLDISDVHGLFAYPGSGKTVLTLDKIYKIKKSTLVIAPLTILYTTWITEHKKWAFSTRLKINILHGPEKDSNFFKTSGIHLINPEGIPWLLEKIKLTRTFPYKVLIVDESVKFKNPKSKRFKALSKLLNSFQYRFILTGNPTPQHYLDLWSQIFILDRGKRLGTSFYEFRNKYFYPTDFKHFNWELLPNSKEKIIQKISDIVTFLEPSSELKLPLRREIKHEINLDTTSKKKYALMQKNLFLQLEESKVSAKNVGVALIKCWQIASGFLYETAKPTIEDPSPTRVTHFIHNHLTEYVTELVESMQGSPTILVYTFNEDLKRLKEVFDSKDRTIFITPESTPEEISKCQKDWNENKIELLITHVNKMSHGVNLQFGKGHEIIFYGLTYNADVYDQLIRRFERQGATYNEVIIHLLIVKDTVHEAIYNSLERKLTSSKDFLDSLNEYKNNCLLLNQN